MKWVCVVCAAMAMVLIGLAPARAQFFAADCGSPASYSVPVYYAAPVAYSYAAPVYTAPTYYADPVYVAPGAYRATYVNFPAFGFGVRTYGYPRYGYRSYGWGW